jgi:hypothetical protein
MTMRMWAPLRAAVLLLAVTACAAPSPKVGKDTRIGQNQGMVALTVQNQVIGGDFMSEYLFEWKRAFIKGGPNNFQVELLARKEGMRDSIVFFAQVSPGTYSLEMLSSLAGYGTYYTVNFPPEEYRFTVKANRITNLGTVVTAIAPRGGFSTSARILRGVLPSDQEMRDYLAGAFPAMLAQHGAGSFETWVNPEPVAKTTELANRIRRFSSGMTTPARAKDGTYYAAAPMGMVWRRSARGQWQSFDTGYAREITALGALADGSILAAAEGGVMLHSSDRGESWKNLGNLPNYGIVLATGQLGAGKVYALVKEERAAHLLVADRPGDAWQSAAAITGPLDTAITSSSTIRVRAVPAGSKLAIVVKDRVVKIYDGATGAWTEQTLPEDVDIAQGLDDGTVFVGHKLTPPKDPKASKTKARKDAEKQTAGVLRKTTDGGATWIDVAPYDTRTQGYAFFSPTVMVRKTDLPADKPEATPTKHQLAYSSDAGKTWTDYEAVDRYFLPSHGAVDGDRLLLFYGVNMVVSADKGKTWRREEFVYPDYSKEKKDAGKE